MFEVSLLAPLGCVERSSQALMDELGALSVCVEDADAHSSDEQVLFGEPGMPVADAGWNRSTLKALFHAEADATRAATWLLAHEACLELQCIAELPNRDWVQLTQAQFKPSEIAPGFWIVPSWHEPPQDARRVIRLDPGQAFGTGTHATTRMCLRWIARHASSHAPWRRVLDYGCGSGILAIAAALHGARSVEAVDIDPIAVGTTRANAQTNGIGVTLHADAPEAAQGVYELVLANILAAPLRLLAPLLAAFVGPGGALVLAGILERQGTELIEAYSPWLALEVSDAEDGWILLTAERRMA